MTPEGLGICCTDEPNRQGARGWMTAPDVAASVAAPCWRRSPTGKVIAGTRESRCGVEEIENTLTLLRQGWEHQMRGQADECPYCRIALVIVCVSFRLKSAVAMWHCPNCAAISYADGGHTKSRSLDCARKFALLAGPGPAGWNKRSTRASNTRSRFSLRQF